MARISASEFARLVQDDCHQSSLVVSYEVQILDDTVVKIRVVLTLDAFIAIFYNADSGKCSYALIEHGVRVFGADNAFIGWHIHPFNAPEEHIPASEVSFADFLSAIENNAQQN